MAALNIASLTPKERLDLIGELWNSLTVDDVALTPGHEAELARRMATFETDVVSAVSWEVVEAELNRQT